MNIAVTGATGFLGRYIVARLAGAGHRLRCWHRPSSDRSHFPGAVPEGAVTWIEGGLGDPGAVDRLLDGADAVVHSALSRTGGFQAPPADLTGYLQLNLMGSLALMDAARRAGLSRFVFVSTCAVYDRILPDRPLDEAHPAWPASDYGAHKAAIEAFVHSFGFGHGFPACALRPTGIYGLAHPAHASKWYGLVRSVARGEPVRVSKGGKEVHAADVARAVEILLLAEEGRILGESFNCYDRYVSEREVAEIARRLTGSASDITGPAPSPRNQIAVGKLAALGMEYGGLTLLEGTIARMIEA
ncbi:3 beta-hydroxysteroid dehydrogenase/Delta 5--_4-isomerase [Aquisphaera giovannonii]|uniref:3 beta-hydroxysteroid dehydrogenase/Delta 5-->4-isomerase n=1 Tax=Aquisphaera giovannonii TaxID=406548 RepID=A0A5B9VYP4_9BACT|nr:NAD(P)-dependent oxidoreductase [Aquisphaera giovannonii]QEH33117.1 3 beta-hydroxysteroid dehydrogenase/Delta 5-->4-isomerase [Aquisphaera giovannonii]